MKDNKLNFNHLIIDGLECDNDKLKDEERISELLNTLPEKIEMKKLSSPMVFKGSDHLPGLTGVVIIETSHIAFHTFTDENKVNIDIYSCKDFDNEMVLEEFKKTFGIKKMIVKGCRRV